MQRDIQISLLALHRMENGMAKRKKQRTFVAAIYEPVRLVWRFG